MNHWGSDFAISRNAIIIIASKNIYGNHAKKMCTLVEKLFYFWHDIFPLVLAQLVVFVFARSYYHCSMIVMNNLCIFFAARKLVFLILYFINVRIEQVVDLLVPGAVQQHHQVRHLPPQQGQPVLSCQVRSVPLENLFSGTLEKAGLSWAKLLTAFASYQ